MNKEDYFISLFDKKYIGDDGALINDMVVSKDLFCENIHFKRDWMSLYQIAQKSMLINISDAIVMNAIPKYALIGIKLPKDITAKQMREIRNGFNDICKKYGINIIGGDTVSGDRIDISVTILSYTKKPVNRKGVKAGDLVAFTGDIGNVGKELVKALRYNKTTSNSKFIKPILRENFFYEASRWINTSLDISDGLSKDLSRLSKINKIGFKFLKKFKKYELCSGEEYEILFTFDKKNIKIIRNIAKKHKTPITIFAKAIRGKYKNICKENHF
ncbi:MAG: thiamine-phosphate kinase [Epsilonproteobacteria bacterium]|nr:thiamine-phosphate kinase [Campylobacterota bacterium]